MKVFAKSADGRRTWVLLELFLKGKFKPVVMYSEGKLPTCPVSFKTKNQKLW